MAAGVERRRRPPLMRQETAGGTGKGSPKCDGFPDCDDLVKFSSSPNCDGFQIVDSCHTLNFRRAKVGDGASRQPSKQLRALALAWRLSRFLRNGSWCGIVNNADRAAASANGSEAAAAPSKCSEAQQQWAACQNAHRHAVAGMGCQILKVETAWKQSASLAQQGLAKA